MHLKQDCKNKINIIIENNIGYDVIKPIKHRYWCHCLNLSKHWKKLTIKSLPLILPIHGQGINVNVKIQDYKRKAN